MLRPELSQHECAVLMADGATGHVLSTYGKVYLSDDSSVYSVFNNINEAREFIRLKQESNETIECCIYNKSYDLIEFYKAPK